MKYILVVFILLWECTCDNAGKELDFPCVNLNNVKKNRIYVDDMADSVEYIHLETTPKCLFDDDGAVINVTPHFILVNDGRFLLFDRHTGRFLREIGKKGVGPGEYWWACSRTFLERYERIYADKGDCWLGFDLHTGQVCDTVSYPDIPKTRILGAVNGCKKLDTDTYVGYVNNISGKDSLLLVFFDKKGRILNTYPNRQVYPDTDKTTYPWDEGHFFCFRDSIYLKTNRYNDTVYKVYPGAVTPRFIFDLGEKAPSIAQKESERVNIGQFFSISETWETTNYILFNYWYQQIEYSAFYNKNTKLTTVCSIGMKSDIQGISYRDNILPAWNIHSVNSFEEVVGVLSTGRVMACMKMHPEKSYLAVFHNLKEDDNPIIVIATLK